MKYDGMMWAVPSRKKTVERVAERWKYISKQKRISRSKKKSLQAKKKAKSAVNASRKNAQGTKFSDL